MKAIRDGLPPAYREAAAQDCCRQLLLSDVYKNAKWVYTYISFGSELDTRALIGIMLDEGKHVAVPKIQGGRMYFYEIKSLADCRPGTWGIPEPEPTPGTIPLNIGGPDTETPDAGPVLMLLPGLAFDREGNRLGYGRGYYDRYLADHPGFFCCGLAYREQLIEAVPTDEHDVRADCMIIND